MNKSELIEELSSQFNQLTQRDVESAVKMIIHSMSNALIKSHRIEIRGFGSFSITHRAARIGRNPRSGESVEVPAKRAIHFKPGKILKESLIASSETQENLKE